jgi:predicted acylesterase/phospholipase RssA
MIKHIVISGGGVNGLSFYGILRESNKCHFWKHSEIKTIYATSIGTIMGVIIALNYDWNITDNYFIKRPWKEVFNFNLENISNLFENKGLFNIKTIESIIQPLLDGKDIDINVTMIEFYSYTKIELHFFATELNNFEITNFSYKTHPNWRLVDVIYCSCCLPILFSPYLIDNKIYIDGGLLLNNPLYTCINENKIKNTDEVLCINKKKISVTLDTNSTFFDYILFLINSIVEKIKQSYQQHIDIKNQINISTNSISLYEIFLASTNIEERINLINIGVNNWNDFFKIK